MRERLRSSVIPAYVLLCLLLGGSVQGVWNVMALQILAIGLIAWAALSPKRESPTGASRALFILVVLAVLLFILQLVPLPPQVWASLPGRDALVNGYASLGLPLPWLPLSVTPYVTLATSLTLLPPIAVLVGILRLHAYEESLVAGAMLLGAFLGVLLGAMQSLGGYRPDAWWYLYRITNDGAVGFFANRNHMGTLLLVSVPFTVALIAAGKPATSDRGRSQGLMAFGAAGFLVALVGLALNLSLAAIALALPVIAFSALMLPGSWRRQRLILAVAAVLTIVAVALFTSSPIRSELAGADTASLDSRLHMWTLTWAAILDNFPAGTGLGSFEQLFRLYEDPRGVGPIYVNHAHNDYLELVLETGLPGLLLAGAFLLWWARQTVAIWRSTLSSHFARAATIASGAILAHSIVDYPLRTVAIAAVFAACLGIMARRSQPSRRDEVSEVRPTKHLVIG